MEPSFVSEDLIWPKVNIPYYYTIYDISSTFDGILVIGRHFVFYVHAHYP